MSMSMMIMKPMPPERLVELDHIFLEPETKKLKLLPSAVFQTHPWDELRQWLHYRAIYFIPTIETVSWLKDEIGERWLSSTIEVGAGTGNLGRSLGIKMCDVRLQDIPVIRHLYDQQGQPRIDYPNDVVHTDALSFVKKHEPRIVVASWVTQKAYWNDDPADGGNMYGPDWRDICAVKSVKKIYFIGSDNVHKRLRFGPQGKLTKHYLDFLVSRTEDSRDNFVLVWRRNQ